MLLCLYQAKEMHANAIHLKILSKWVPTFCIHNLLLLFINLWYSLLFIKILLFMFEGSHYYSLTLKISLLFSWLSANITKHRSETNKRGKLHLSSSALRHHPFLLQSFNFTWPLFLYMWWSEVKRVWKLWKMRIGHFFFLWFLRFLMVCGFIKAGKSKII